MRYNGLLDKLSTVRCAAGRQIASRTHHKPWTLGQAIDGYLVGATVWVDLDGDGIKDDNEPETTTDKTGAFEFIDDIPAGTDIYVEGGLLSHADLWTLAANIAIEIMGGPHIPTRFGRLDAKDYRESVDS